MNIRKHLNRILLASTAIFWASCNDDAQSSNPTAAPTSSVSNEDQQQTDISNEQPQCRETGKVVKQEFSTGIMNDPVAYATEDAKKSAEKSAQISIRDSVESAAMRIENELSKPFDDSLDMKKFIHLDLSAECLWRMLDTLAEPVAIYGILFKRDSIATKIECDDGTTYIRDEYLRYQEELEEYEKKYATYKEIYTESFKKIEEKREAELKDLMDSCINHPEDFSLYDEDEDTGA
ncbi:hypothetical protein [uncultured Fibrobacter sp.]|uniref:hypothetical protein n=1 Tax=uncultured Fibrobacter sp. TaxID=261512 RepID=UPI0025D040B6|nr:hypothetical protein [uncultured Fibrobacter sp.]